MAARPEPEPLKRPEDLDALMEKRSDLAKALFDDDMPSVSKPPNLSKSDSIGRDIVQRVIESVRKKQEYTVEPVQFTLDDMINAVVDSVTEAADEPVADEMPGADEIVDLPVDNDAVEEEDDDDGVDGDDYALEPAADTTYEDVGTAWSSDGSAAPALDFDYEYGSSEASFDW